MNVYEPSAHADCFSKFTQNYSFSHFQTISNISLKPANERTLPEKRLLVDLLHHIHNVNQTFKVSNEYRTYLLQCSDHIEAYSYKRGDPLLLRGDKCNEIFIILDGTVNIYDLKTSQEVQKQMEEAKEALERCASGTTYNRRMGCPNVSMAFNKGSNQTSMIMATRRQGYTCNNIDQENLSLDLLSDLDRASSTNVSTRQPVFTNRRKIKIRSIVAFLRTKGGQNSSIKEIQDNYINYLPESELLLLEDSVCKTKYFKEGACLLSLKDSIGTGDIINEKCLLSDFRSPVTVVAEDDVQCLKLSKQVFRDILKEEIKAIEEKKDFMLDFFQDASQVAVLRILGYIVEKKFKMHETIYKQGDKCKGMYFVKGGGEVKLYLNMTQPNKEQGDSNDQTDLFLPYQQKSQRKQTLAVGIIGKGDFFGEEEVIMEEARKYTVISASEHLTLYYIASKYYSTIAQICPAALGIIRERAEHRNKWMENNIKNSEAVKEKAKELFHITQAPMLITVGSQCQKKCSPRTQAERKSLKKVLLVKDEDVQQIAEGNLPYYFAIAREKEPPKQSNEAKTSNYKEFKSWVAPDYNTTKDKNTSKQKPTLKQIGENNLMRSMDLPPSYKLFEQERNGSKKLGNKALEESDTTNSMTMTGLKKDKDFIKALQTRVLKQANISSPKEGQNIIPSNISYRKGPQLGVKSYMTPLVESKPSESQKSTPKGKTVKGPLAKRLAKPMGNSPKSILSSLSNLQSGVNDIESRRTECTIHGESTGFALYRPAGRAQSEALLAKEIFSCRTVINGSEKNKFESSRSFFKSDAAESVRKNSKVNVHSLGQLNRATGDKTEAEDYPSIHLDEAMPKSSHSHFRPKVSKLGNICKKI